LSGYALAALQREATGKATTMDHPQAPVLDDRMSSNKVLERAQELMADAVHAEQTFFSTCGSSLSVKSAMLAVAGPGGRNSSSDAMPTRRSYRG
jgi:arginine/lysine/ornithine decarboxylase